jgi:hypothetical protein
MRWLAGTLCLFTLPILGCGGGSAGGPPYANVTGVVTLDGKPIEGATVTFSPKKEGAMSMGLTDAQGKFSLKTATGKKGAAVGEHDVAITLRVDLGPEAPAGSQDDLAPALEVDSGPAVKKPTVKWVIPERYSDPKKSGLSVTVPAGGLSDHKFDLTSK